MTALEQIDEGHDTLLEYLLKHGSAFGINVEPIVELYESENLLGQLAERYHRQRGYLLNYLAALRTLEEEGQIEILCTRRMYCGGFYNESYLIVVWKPC